MSIQYDPYKRFPGSALHKILRSCTVRHDLDEHGEKMLCVRTKDGSHNIYKGDYVTKNDKGEIEVCTEEEYGKG